MKPAETCEKRIREALAGFYDPAEIELWLHSQHQELAGERPARVIEDGRAGEVWAIIDRLQSGAYV